ncbi:Ig-like domain-containing protein [candidate division KSB1 bacterium]|nr:Ig-like domain-containing protein [candidate division KSB1 bacterium]
MRLNIGKGFPLHNKIGHRIMGVGLLLLLFWLSNGLINPGYLCAQEGTGQISGIVIDMQTRTPIPGVKVRAEIWPRILKDTITDADGRYTISNLVAGNYVIYTICPNELFYMDEVYDNQFEKANANKIKLNTGQHVTNINFELGTGGKIQGRTNITGTLVPLKGVGVHFIMAKSRTVHSRVITDSLGNYRSNALPPGKYYVKAVASSIGYVSAFYSNTRFREDALEIEVQVNQTVRNIDFRLKRGTAITGMVRTENDTPLKGAWIVVMQPRDSVWASEAKTNERGEYEARGVDVDTQDGYAVGVLEASSGNYKGEFYDNKPSILAADRVYVTSRDIKVNNINFVLNANNVDTISNQYLSAIVSDRYPGSSLNLANIEGLPNTPADDGAALLFGYPLSDMSYTTIRIGGQDVRFGSEHGQNLQALVKSQDGKTITRAWQFNAIQAIQRIKLVNSTWSVNKAEDTILLQYVLINTDATRIENVGLRILLDTMLGSDDGALIRVPYYRNYNMTNEMSFDFPTIPPWWTAMGRDPQTGEIIFSAQGTIKGSDATVPDKFVIANWHDWEETSWDYDAKKDKPIKDSSVMMWWNPRDIAPGDSLVINTYYGLGEGTPDYEPPYLVRTTPVDGDENVAFHAPVEIEIADAQSAIDTSSIKTYIKINNGQFEAIDRYIHSDNMKQVRIILQPKTPLKCNQIVAVRLDPVSDLAEEPNMMPAPVEFSFKVIRDLSAPIIIDHYPLHKQKEVSSTEAIVVKLKDNLAGIDSTQTRLYVGDVLVPAKFTRNDSIMTLRFEPVTPYQINSTILVKVQTRDLADPANVMADSIFKFYTFKPDTNPPYTRNHFPKNLAQSVAVSTPISVEVLDQNPGVAAKSIIMRVNGEEVSMKITGDSLNYLVEYHPIRPFRYNDTVKVQIDAADLETEPNKMKTDSWQFYIARDNDAPFLADLSPANGDTNQFVSAPITFSIRDTIAGVDYKSIWMKLNNVLVTPELDTSDFKNIRVTFNQPEPFKSKSKIEFTVFARDLARQANEMGPLTFHFYTGDSTDLLPPYITQLVPDSNKVITNLSTDISFHILDRISGVDQNSIQLIIADSIVRPEISGNKFDYFVRYQMPRTFTYNETCRVEIIAKDFAVPANRMSLKYRFFTPIDRIPPVVKETIPANNDTNVTQQPLIIISLYDEVAGVDTNSVVLKINDIQVKPVFDSRAQNLIVKYQTKTIFQYEELVKMTIMAADLSTPPNFMKQPVEVNFRIRKPIPDKTPPYTEGHQPGRFSLDVPVHQKFQVHIKDDILGVDSSSIKIELNSKTIKPIIAGNLNDYQVLYHSRWNYNDSIAVKISAQDLSPDKNKMTESYYFKTLIDRNGPAISRKKPLAGSSGISQNTEIQFNISDLIAGVDIQSLHFLIDDIEIKNYTMSGDSANYQIQYKPLHPFNFGDTVNVVVKVADLVDPANLTIEKWQFVIQTSIDMIPPFITDLFPRDKSENVPSNSEISFYVRDNQSGVDRETIKLFLNGIEKNIQIDGEPAAFQVRYRPERLFFNGEQVSGVIYAADLANPANSMDPYPFSFQVEDNLPDLIVNKLVTIPDGHIKKNERVILQAEIENKFASTGKSFYVQFQTNGQAMENSDSLIQALPADTTITISKSMKFPIGTYYLKVVVDSRDNIPETFEMNNIKELVISVEEGEFFVKPNPFTPNGDGFNDDAKFDFSQLNLANPQLRLFNFEHHNFLTIQSNSTYQFTWNGRDASGHEMPPGLYLYLLEDGKTVAAKGYIILAR